MVEDHDDTSIIVEKISVINLLVAFAYATKHYIRSEYSYEEDDLKDLIAHLPRTFMPSFNTTLLEQESTAKLVREGSTGDLRKNSGPPPTTASARRRRNSVPYVTQADPIPTNIPLEISYFIQSYIKSASDRALFEKPTQRILDTGKTK